MHIMQCVLSDSRYIWSIGKIPIKPTKKNINRSEEEEIGPADEPCLYLYWSDRSHFHSSEDSLSSQLSYAELRVQVADGSRGKQRWD